MSTSHHPFVVRAHMATPVSIRNPVHLEAILYAVRFDYDPSTMGTPLDCLTYQDGIPKASAGYLVHEGLDGASSDTMKIVKSVRMMTSDQDRIEIRNAPSKLRRIDAMSPYRPSLQDYPVLSGVTEVVFQAVGDPEVVLSMLQRAKGIGTLRSRGFGEVRDWSLSDTESDVETCGWFSGDRVLRCLPSDRVASDAPFVSRKMARLEPPFWDGNDRIMIAQPTVDSLLVHSDEIRTIMGH